MLERNSSVHSMAGWKAYNHRERREAIIVEMRKTAQTFRQSYLDGIHSVALICT